MFYTIEWKDNVVRILDQVRLPQEVCYLDCSTYQMVVSAIARMNIRGAPAIGIAAALGIALGAEKISCQNKKDFLTNMDKICDEFFRTRPTAVNLVWAINRLKKVAVSHPGSVEEIKKAIKAEALKIREMDVEVNKALGKHGAVLVPQGATILTHCNAGALATGGYGTALGVIRAAYEADRKISVYADETRPFLQGARLTAWELLEEGIPVTLITDNMAGYFMSKRKIDLIIVGADRVAANADVANKIGTYSLAILARAHHIPFYVAAPVSSFDLTISDGEEIPIEERDPREVTTIGDICFAPQGVKVANPAFDITPHDYISAIITEKGIIYPPYQENLSRVLSHE